MDLVINLAMQDEIIATIYYRYSAGTCPAFEHLRDLWEGCLKSIQDKSVAVVQQTILNYLEKDIKEHIPLLPGRYNEFSGHGGIEIGDAEYACSVLKSSYSPVDSDWRFGLLSLSEDRMQHMNETASTSANLHVDTGLVECFSFLESDEFEDAKDIVIDGKTYYLDSFHADDIKRVLDAVEQIGMSHPFKSSDGHKIKFMK